MEIGIDGQQKPDEVGPFGGEGWMRRSSDEG